MKRWQVAVASVLLLLGCKTPAPQPRARIAVEILYGLSASPIVSSPLEDVGESVTILLDISSSAQGEEGRSQQAARAGFRRLRDSLGPEHRVDVWTLDANDERCAPTVGEAPLAGAEGPAHGEKNSIAGAVERIAANLEREAELSAGRDAGRHRVAVFTDRGACLEDICRAAARLVGIGAGIDFSLFGDAPVPACLALAAQGNSNTASPHHDGDRAPPRFWVEPADAEPGVGGALAAGRADGASRSLPAGRVYVHVEFDGPVRFGPIDLAPDTEILLRILDFRTLEPPVREWSWQSRAIPSGLSVRAPTSP